MARARPTHPPHIHKFGGASLADAAAIGHAVGIVLAQRPGPLVVVVSAMSGVTDALLDGAARAARGDASHVRAAAVPSGRDVGPGRLSRVRRVGGATRTPIGNLTELRKRAQDKQANLKAWQDWYAEFERLSQALALHWHDVLQKLGAAQPCCFSQRHGCCSTSR